MAIAYWPYEEYMNFKVSQLQYAYRPKSVVYIYNINQFVMGTLF